MKGIILSAVLVLIWTSGAVPADAQTFTVIPSMEILRPKTPVDGSVSLLQMFEAADHLHRFELALERRYRTLSQAEDRAELYRTTRIGR